MIMCINEMSSFIYAVKTGRVPGIYHTWEETEKQINGYSNACYKKFKQQELSEAYRFAGIPKKIKPVIKKRPTPVKTHSLSQQEIRYYQHRDHNSNSSVLHVYTDGSTINNGKKNATGGYGVFFADPDIPYISRELTSGKITNNVAELKGIIEALKVINGLNGYQHVIIHYDSDYAAGVITGRKNAYSNLDLVHEGQDLLKQSNKIIQFEHVYSHTGKDDLHSIGNCIVDDLAKRIPL